MRLCHTRQTMGTGARPEAGRRFESGARTVPGLLMMALSAPAVASQEYTSQDRPCYCSLRWTDSAPSIGLREADGSSISGCNASRVTGDHEYGGRATCGESLAASKMELPPVGVVRTMPTPTSRRGEGCVAFDGCSSFGQSGAGCDNCCNAGHRVDLGAGAGHTGPLGGIACTGLFVLGLMLRPSVASEMRRRLVALMLLGGARST